MNVKHVQPEIQILPHMTACNGLLLDLCWSRRSRARPPAFPLCCPAAALCGLPARAATFACVGAGISPISSSSSVPPSASSKQPMRRSAAPVNAPRSWPKISLSIKLSGIAEQLIATNGPPARGESLCTVRATISLPEPVSPVMSTEAELGAAISMMRITSCIGFELADQIRQPAGPAQLPLQYDSSCRASLRALPKRPFQQRAQHRTFQWLFDVPERAGFNRSRRLVLRFLCPVMMIAGTSCNFLAPDWPAASSPFMPGSSTSAINVSG